jgi:transcriptional regulator with XRE-family HTH domain
VSPFPSRDTLLAIFGERVKARRIALQMPQEALAEAVGYENQTIIAKIEGGLSLPSFDKAVAIAAVLGFSLDLSSETHSAFTLLSHALEKLSDMGRREFLLVAAIVLEGMLPEPARSQLCRPLRFLAHTEMKGYSFPRKQGRRLKKLLSTQAGLPDTEL